MNQISCQNDILNNPFPSYWEFVKNSKLYYCYLKAIFNNGGSGSGCGCLTDDTTIDFNPNNELEVIISSTTDNNLTVDSNGLFVASDIPDIIDSMEYATKEIFNVDI
ncbi:MAG: hypothetical protein CfClM3_0999 [Methanobrevibacter sp. CfCl-M3]